MPYLLEITLCGACLNSSGEVGENEGTHHLIEARASLLRSPRQMKKEGAPPQQLRDF